MIERLLRNSQDSEDESALFAKQIAMDLRKLGPERRLTARMKIASILAEENIRQISDHKLDNIKSEFNEWTGRYCDKTAYKIKYKRYTCETKF